MVPTPGKYQYVRDNFPDFLMKKGVPADKIKAYKPPLSLKIDIEGEKYTITKTFDEGTHTMQYVVGQQVEDHWPGLVLKSLPKLDKNVLIIESRDEKGVIRTRNYSFVKDGVEVTLKSPDGLEGKTFFEKV
ncbi:uncharacterized protein [Leptinotarsa decemlineata]|uniref:uncharacterized protein n=1 Tax=Leptinotarsa decemlineata TaxID=7539 RepID=UPI000C255754|nr:uncharacterized protein LOC111517657 [Leptinotarsa decemlineata]